MKARNHYIESTDQDHLYDLAEQYDDIGFDVELEQGKLTVFALPRWARSRKQKMRDAKIARAKKREKKNVR